MSVKVAFHSYQLGQRGTEIHLYKYAKFNQEILGNESIVISTSSRPTPALDMFSKEFKVVLYPDVWVPDGVNLQLRTTLERVVDDQKITHFWAIKGGESDGFMPTNAKTFAHCVFNMSQPHGDIYAGICKYISKKHGGSFPWVYPIVEKESPETTEDYREELGIPKNAIVMGRHGGSDTFSLNFVKQAIYESLMMRGDLHFVFLNTDKFIDHPRVHHLPYTSDFSEKAKFVNTCDAMIHARSDGEIFSLSIAEFSTRNKPVISWLPRVPPPEYDLGHLEVLGNNAIYYENSVDLKQILLNITKEDIRDKNWDVYGNTFSPESVMKDFERLFLK